MFRSTETQNISKFHLIMLSSTGTNTGCSQHWLVQVGVFRKIVNNEG